MESIVQTTTKKQPTKQQTWGERTVTIRSVLALKKMAFYFAQRFGLCEAGGGIMSRSAPPNGLGEIWLCPPNLKKGAKANHICRVVGSSLFSRVS